MYGFLIVIHVIACTLLILTILIQVGRGGGLIEMFSGMESIFGPKTSTFLTRLTSILATIFIISCVFLAFISAQKSKSLMERRTIHQKISQEQPIEKPHTEELPLEKPQIEVSAEEPSTEGLSSEEISTEELPLQQP